jgi:hypothetical protein
MLVSLLILIIGMLSFLLLSISAASVMVILSMDQRRREWPRCRESDERQWKSVLGRQAIELHRG